ncbi:MAG: pyrroline-5-carboxylate reductase [Magnetococcales bacterium]|nr:pyrroline-5-carboxylate reductase [Magnetococcales bacterium]
MFQKVLVLGFGNMSSAIVKRMLSAGTVDKSAFYVVSHGGKSTQNMESLDLHGFDGQAGFDTVLLGLKPQNYHEILPEYEKYLKPDAVIVSMMAGVQSQNILKYTQNQTFSVVRIMPNTPCSIGEGVVGTFFPVSWNQNDKLKFQEIFECCGDFVEVTHEDDLHIITAIAGSGPAYFFYVMEAMAKKAEACGLDYDTAQRLVAATCKGAGAYATFSLKEKSITELKLDVVSKGGTTEAGLNMLDSCDVSTSVEKAVGESFKKSIKLS